MLRKIRRVAIFCLILFVVLIGLLVGLYRFTPVVDQAILSLINRLANEQVTVKFSRLSGNLFGTIRMDSLQVDGQKFNLKTDQIDLSYSLMDVARWEFNIRNIQLRKPTLTLNLTDTTADTSRVPIDSILAAIDLSKYPVIKLKQLTIEDGTAFLLRTTGQDTLEQVNLRFRGKISAEDIVLEPTEATAYWRNRDIRLDGLSFRLQGNEQRITVNRFAALIPDMKLAGRAEIEIKPALRFRVFVDTSHVSHNVIRKFYPNFPYAEGQMDIYGTFDGLGGKFDGDFYLSGVFDNLEIGSLKANYHGENQTYVVDNLNFSSSFGDATGSLQFSPTRENRVRLNFSNVDLRQTGLVEDTIIFSGSIDADIDSWKWKTISGYSNLALYNLHYNKYRADAIVLNIVAERGIYQIQAPSQLLLAGDASISLTGKVQPNKETNLHVSMIDANLDSFFGRLGLAQYGGSGSMDLQISGKFDDPSIKGELLIDSLKWANSMVSGVDGYFDVKKILTDRRGDLDFEIATAYFGDLFLTGGLTRVGIDRNTIAIRQLEFFSEENNVHANGTITLTDRGITALLDTLKLEYESYSLEQQHPISVRYSQDSLYVDALSLVTPDGGFLNGRGFLALNGSSDLLVEVEKIRLEPFNQYIIWDYHLNGLLGGQVTLFGQLDNPEVELLFTADSLMLNGNFIGKLSSEVVLQDGGIGVNFLDYERDADSYLTINGSFDIAPDSSAEEVDFNQIPLIFKVDIENLRLEDYAFLYDINFPIEGHVSGRIELNGTMAAPAGVVELQGSAFRIAEVKIDELALEGNLTPELFTIEQANMMVEKSNVRIRGEKRLTWDPNQMDSLFADKYIYVELNIDEDSLNFLNTLNPELDRLDGRILLSAILEGDYDEPRLTGGSVDISGGTLYLARLENPLEDLFVKGHIQGSTLVFDEMRARAPKRIEDQSFFRRWASRISGLFFKRKVTGDITGRGSVDLSNILRPKMDLLFTADDVYINYFLENTRLVASTENLSIKGRDTISVSGDILISEGQITLDLIESEKNLLFAPTVREIPPFLRYNLALEMPNMVVRSEETFNSFDMQAQGNIRVQMEPRALMEMYGALTIDGKYFIQGEDFAIKDGTIDFVNPKEVPELNLTAEKRKNNMVFNLTVTGPLTDPEKKMVIEDESGNTLPYTDTKDQIALLLFGVTFDQLSGSDANSILLTKGEQVLTQAVISAIENEARDFVGVDRFRIESEDSFLKNRLNKRSTLALGKYLSPNLYFEYTATLGTSGLANIPSPTLSWEAGNQVYLQYRLNRNWAFSSTFQKTEESNRTVKFDINWQVEF